MFVFSLVMAIGFSAAAVICGLVFGSMILSDDEEEAWKPLGVGLLAALVAALAWNSFAHTPVPPFFQSHGRRSTAPSSPPCTCCPSTD